MMFAMRVFVALVAVCALATFAEAKRCKGVVHYNVTFRGLWGERRTPRDYPGEAAVFSPPVAFAHTSNFYAHRVGKKARTGIKELAETGNVGPLSRALRKKGRVGSPVVVGDLVPATGSTTFSLMVSPYRRYATVMSMMAPSPDWFVATRTSLCDTRTGKWKTRVREFVTLKDAGTDDGVTFMAADKPRATPGVVKTITEKTGDIRYPFWNPEVPIADLARVIFTKKEREE